MRGILEIPHSALRIPILRGGRGEGNSLSPALMSIFLKIAAVCVGVLLLQIWNLWRGRRLGRIFLGALQYDRIAFVVNILWVVIVALFLLFCCLKAAGTIR